MSLSTYTKDAQTELFEKTGTFFAFSQDQYDKAAIAEVEYVSLGMGMIVPKGNTKALVAGLSDINETGIKKDLKENGKKKIIERELFNYECFYTGEIEDCVEALKEYQITESEIREEYHRIYPTVEM